MVSFAARVFLYTKSFAACMLPLGVTQKPRYRTCILPLGVDQNLAYFHYILPFGVPQKPRYLGFWARGDIHPATPRTPRNPLGHPQNTD